MRIIFRDLNEAIVHPRVFRRKLRGPQGSPPIFRYSYYNVLLNSIFHFHNCRNDPNQAEDYLADKLNSFKNDLRKEIISDQLHWYVEDYLSKDITTFEVRQNIRILPQIPLNLDFPYQTETWAGCYGKIASKARIFTFTVKGLLEEPNG